MIAELEGDQCASELHRQLQVMSGCCSAVAIKAVELPPSMERPGPLAFGRRGTVLRARAGLQGGGCDLSDGTHVGAHRLGVEALDVSP